jgi:hypothetical protein
MYIKHQKGQLPRELLILSNKKKPMQSWEEAGII